MMNLASNHRPLRRLSLSDEINRLNWILDGLGEALNESIEAAAREGGRLAVREVAGELATELLVLLHAFGPSPPPLTAGPPCPARSEPTYVFHFTRSVAAGIVHGCLLIMGSLMSSLIFGAVHAGKVPVVIWRRAKPVLVPVITGMVLGAGAYSVATDAGAALSAAAGAFVSLAVRPNRSLG
jgi:hypothetical protein